MATNDRARRNGARQEEGDTDNTGRAGRLASTSENFTESMDKYGASAWMAGFGAAIIAVAMAAQTVHGMSDLTSGEFVAVLVSGVLFVAIGVGYRLGLGYVAGMAKIREYEETGKAMRESHGDTGKSLDDITGKT